MIEKVKNVDHIICTKKSHIRYKWGCDFYDASEKKIQNIEAIDTLKVTLPNTMESFTYTNIRDPSIGTKIAQRADFGKYGATCTLEKERFSIYDNQILICRRNT